MLSFAEKIEVLLPNGSSTLSQTVVHHFFTPLLSTANEYLIAMADTSTTTRKRITETFFTSWSSPSLAQDLRLVFYWFYTLLGLGRLILCSLVLNLELSLETYSSVDPLGHFFVQSGLLDRYLALALTPTPVQLLYFHYLVHFARGFRCYLLVYELTVLNGESFERLNPKITTWKAFFQSLWVMDKKIKFKYQKLPHFIPLDHEVRCRTLVIATLGNYIFAASVFLLAVVMFLGNAHYQTVVFWPEYGARPLSALLLMDLTLALYASLYFIKLALFFALQINIFTYAAAAQQRRNNDQLRVLLVKVEKGGQAQNTPIVEGLKNRQHHQHPTQPLLCYRFPGEASVHLSAYLANRYLSSHLQLLTDLVSIDEELLSTAFFLCLLTFFSLDVYALCVLVTRYRVLSTGEWTLLLSILLIIVMSVTAGTMPVLQLHRVVHSPAPLLFRAVQVVGNSTTKVKNTVSVDSLRLKLKLSTRYEVLTSGPKFAISMGPLGPVTPNAALQVRYSVFFKQMLYEHLFYIYFSLFWFMAVIENEKYIF